MDERKSYKKLENKYKKGLVRAICTIWNKKRVKDQYDEYYY